MSLRVGFALSGGGHRAAVWGAGAVIGYLRARDLEAKKTADEHTAATVVSIASVSGGSIANGAVAVNAGALNSTSAADVAKALGPVLKDIAEVGAFPAKGRTMNFVAATGLAALAAVLATAATVGGAFASGRGWSTVQALGWPLAVGVAGALFLKKWARLAPLVLALAFGAGALITGRHSSTVRVLVIAAVAAVLWLLVVRLWARRGEVFEHTLRKHFFNDVTLADLSDREVHHVFCATELQTGRQMYLTPKVLSSWSLGHSSDTTRISLARAVQASAALPGAFPPQETEFKKAGLSFTGGAKDFKPDRLALVDGGVYDNMGDQWEQGLAERNQRLSDAKPIQEAANFLVVANAGKALAPLAFGAVSRLAREVRGLARDQQIQYDQSTAPRRHGLVREFIAARTNPTGNHLGVIVQASTSPMSMAKPGNEADAATHDRARQWRERLEQRRDAAAWKSLADTNADVKTTLAKLGRPTTVDLLEHAIVLTQCALHVHYGFGSVDVVDRAELELLVADGG